MMRLAHKLYANLFGYFWLPCPVCGEHFGGHEVSAFSGAVIVEKEDGPHAYCVCSKNSCQEEAKRRSGMPRVIDPATFNVFKPH